MSLNYLIRKATPTITNPPLLLLLHGYGSNEADLFSFAEALSKEYLIISAQAPYSMGFGQYAWYAINFDAKDGKFSDVPQAIASRDKIIDFIDSLQAEHTFDSEQVTLLGFSQGAILSYSLALTYPEKIKQAIALSGYHNEAISQKPIDWELVKTIPFFSSHGTIDQVLPVSKARETVAFLKEKQCDVSYHEYPNLGHGVSPENFEDLKQWLEERTL